MSTRQSLLALSAALALLAPGLTAVAQPSLTLRSAELSVAVGAEFPRVVVYTDRRSGAVLHGRSAPLTSIQLNGADQRVTGTARSAVDSVRYALTFPDLPGVRLDASLALRGRTLTFRIDQVRDTAAFRVGTIDIPGHDLLTVRAADPAPQVAAARVELNKNGNGDRIYPVTTATTPDATPLGSAYGMVSTGKLAAAIETNSTYDNNGGAGADENGRIWRQARQTPDGPAVSVWSGRWTHRAQGSPDTEPAPWAKVTLTGERNGDGVLDWQDAAIAFRDIMWQPKGWEKTKDRVVQRIPFNIASSATHPFTRTLDDTKRVNQATDGLGQFVLLKGYQSEGHDAAHPDYGGHYNERAGGLRGLNTLLQQGKRWNADFGVHVNATESYPEARAFSETLVDKNNKQWAWMDQSYRIDQRRDLTSGDIQRRLAELQRETRGGLDFLYFDVFRETGWTADRLQREVRKLGWEMATEWSHRLERETLWTHWATDIDYSSETHRGINSSIIRLARNHQKDVFVHHPLLMGARIVEFEGWTGETDYRAFLANTFEQNLPTKYLQHFPVQRLSTVEAVLDGGVSVTAPGGKRQFRKDGRLLYDDGAYLLPWSPTAPDKAYHWNPAGGTSTWDLPVELAGQSSVRLYRLTDDGRQHVGALPVRDGKVTITAEARTPYLVTAQSPAPAPRLGYGEGTPTANPGFDSGDLTGWRTSGAAKVETNDLGQREAVVRGGAASLSQRLTLPRGQYAASLMVEVEPGKSRPVTVFAGGKETRLARSTVTNIVASEEKKGTKSQRVRVFFSSDGSTEVGVRVGAGDAVVRLDDLRVVAAPDPGNRWDFERVDQGFGPFVPGGEIAPTDARTHLAEKHAPFTQRGWNGKAVDDVIEGNWSLKSFEYAAHLAYRTTPATVRFEPGHRYRVSFRYAAAGTAYSWVVGEDPANGAPRDVSVTPLPARGEPGTHTVEFTASSTGDTWVGLRRPTGGDGEEFTLDEFAVFDLDAGGR
ncbi:endo-alpha-N-acetylgalactosaminidase family protein [Crossiella cryophila]|uniref:Endo-alpha-N-acetylgalactosaminidase n=1 Tax=Crossiella cryophila TaxID=43355 RepID=A0A7W7CD14_9PSEU|nr:endo-alpha-N-acetylgalactosaminidase family protein [Crossiella cryophila]MBB4678870.1 endo-alpha-N-acetylgalactosaminidase [Crossiella cryophila]